MTNIISLREELGLSQLQLADRLKTTQQTVARWEAGKAFPSAEMLMELSELFETTVDDILGLSARNPAWSTDELILALELYLVNPTSPPGKRSDEVAELSATLNRVAEWMGTKRADRFRNPNGVYMKLMNFRRFDPQFADAGKVGLSRGNREEETVWKMYAQDRERLSIVADAIKTAVQTPPDESFDRDAEPETEEAEEGRVLTRLHRQRERSRKLVELKKQEAQKAGKGIQCEACGFDYGAKYGERGDGYMQVHHIKPLHTLPAGTKTRVEDLALVCANCHGMIHAKRQWLTLDQLRSIISENR